MEDQSIEQLAQEAIAEAKQTGPGRGGKPKTAKPPAAPPEGFWHQAARATISQLPGIGATAGGALGATVGAPAFGAGALPVGIAGATIGGATGEALRQNIVRWFPEYGDAPDNIPESLLEIGKQAGLGGASEVAGPYIGKVLGSAGPWLKDSAKRSLIAVMQPIDKYSKGHALQAAKQLLKGPAFGKTGYVVPLRSSLEKRAEENIAKIGEQIGQAEAPVAQKTIDPQMVQDLKDTLDRYRGTMYMPTKTVPGTPIPTVQAKYGSAPKLDAIDNIRQLLDNEMPGVASNGQIVPGTGSLSRESLRLIRQSLDESIRDAEGFARQAMVSGGAVEPALAAKLKIERKMSDYFRGLLNKDEPNIAAMNSEYHLWNNVKDAMSPATLAKEFSKDTSPWQQLWHSRHAQWLASGAAAGGGAYKLGGANAAEATGALFAVAALTKTALWRTMSAASKNALSKQLADGLASGQLENVAKLATRAAYGAWTADDTKTPQPPKTVSTPQDLLNLFGGSSPTAKPPAITSPEYAMRQFGAQ